MTFDWYSFFLYYYLPVALFTFLFGVVPFLFADDEKENESKTDDLKNDCLPELCPCSVHSEYIYDGFSKKSCAGSCFSCSSCSNCNLYDCQDFSFVHNSNDDKN